TILAVRDWLTISPLTEAPLTSGEPTLSPAISTSPNVTDAPASPGKRERSSTSPWATLYCFPPLRMTANMPEILGLTGKAKYPRRKAAHYSQGPWPVNPGTPVDLQGTAVEATRASCR